MKPSIDADVMKSGMDIASLSAVGGWLVGVLPAIATLLSVVWFALRIVEQLKGMGWIGSSPPPPNNDHFNPSD